MSLLSASGFDAQVVHSGADALAFVRSHAVALILLDMSMPDMSGVEALRAVRILSDGLSPPPPVVMFSADDYQANRDELIELGATAFVSKSTREGCCASSKHMSARPLPHVRH